MSLKKLLFFIFYCAILTLPAMSQTTPTDNQTLYQQESQLHEELRDAVKGGDKQKADQFRGQLISLQKQQFAQRKQLSDALREAIKSGDKQKAGQLREQLMAAMMPQGMGAPSGKPWMLTDPQAVALHQELQDAIKSKDKQKADQVRAQLNSLYKQHFAQMKQLLDQLREAAKSGDKPKAQQLREQLMSMMP